MYERKEWTKMYEQIKKQKCCFMYEAAAKYG